MADMNQTPKGGRVHIGIFGRRNAGKSSVINALTKQKIALVSDVAGTTTDPVYKAMELLPIGPVMLIDTAGIDDVGDLGKMRVGKTREVMAKTDIALLIQDVRREFSEFEQLLIQEFKKRGIPYILVANQCDREEALSERLESLQAKAGEAFIPVSSLNNSGFAQLRSRIISNVPAAFEEKPLLRDLLTRGDKVLFCVPIDTAAPKGRLILPQVQALRDTLDADAQAFIAKEDQIETVINDLKTPPNLVVVDSQVFGTVSKIVPKEIPLTSFSILMARHKGDLNGLVAGAVAIDSLQPGDSILIAEACTHQCQAEDIGRVKIPKWLKKHVGGELHIEWYTGDSFPEDVTPYKLVVHCGACMINRKAMLSRQRQCQEAKVPIVNYGVLIAYVHGILPRVLSPFPELKNKLKVGS